MIETDHLFDVALLISSFFVCSCTSLVGNEPALAADTGSTQEASVTPSDGRSSRSDSSSETKDKAQLELSDATIEGICLAHSWQDGGTTGYGSKQSRKTLEYLKNMGVEAVSLNAFASMPGLNSPKIHGEHNGELSSSAETKDRIEKVVEQAKSLEMNVVLKPHIWVENGGWRGNIKPKKNGEVVWQQWWNNYEAFILYYAHMAERLDIETFVFGVELKSAIPADTEAFRDVVKKVRQTYSGHLTYASNWNESLSKDLWRLFDSVGLQFYRPLTDKDDPTLHELRWQIRSHLRTWAKRASDVQRPLNILEVGYKSAPTAVEKPYGWPEDLPESQRVPDQKLQAKAYRALFMELKRLENLRAVYLWKYFADPANDEGDKVGFSPRDKEAESVLKQAY